MDHELPVAALDQNLVTSETTDDLVSSDEGKRHLGSAVGVVDEEMLVGRGRANEPLIEDETLTIKTTVQSLPFVHGCTGHGLRGQSNP